jgi:hypothetical protein
MGIFQRSKRGQLKKLQIQLENANRQLDAMEARSAHRLTAAGLLEKQLAENPETRFAACVASGMSKLQGSMKPEG